MFYSSRFGPQNTLLVDSDPLCCYFITKLLNQLYTSCVSVCLYYESDRCCNNPFINGKCWTFFYISVSMNSNTIWHLWSHYRGVIMCDADLSILTAQSLCVDVTDQNEVSHNSGFRELLKYDNRYLSHTHTQNQLSSVLEEGLSRLLVQRTSLPCLLWVGGGTLKQSYPSDLNFSCRSLTNRWENMREYGWNSVKDLIFRNPAVVDQVRF